jgi:hypothetical protein
MYSAEIARKLRDKAQDVTSVSEEPDFAGCSDEDLITEALTARRVILTNNVGDFAQLAVTVEHYGILFTSDRSLPRSRQTIGLYVEMLDGFMNQHREDGALRGQWLWLGSSSSSA